MLRPLFHLMGLDSASGTAYLAWSGILSDVGEIVLIGAFVAWYRRNNCHVDGCHRISHRQSSGLDERGQPVTYHLCRRHAPGAAPTHAQVIAAHHRARSGEASERLHAEGRPDAGTGKR